MALHRVGYQVGVLLAALLLVDVVSSSAIDPITPWVDELSSLAQAMMHDIDEALDVGNGTAVSADDPVTVVLDLTRAQAESLQVWAAYMAASANDTSLLLPGSDNEDEWLTPCELEEQRELEGGAGDNSTDVGGGRRRLREPCPLQQQGDRGVELDSWKVTVHTSDVRYAGTDADVEIGLQGREGRYYAKYKLDKPVYDDFERKDTDTYTILHTALPYTPDSVEGICIAVTSDGGEGPAWHCGWVEVRFPYAARNVRGYRMNVNAWLEKDSSEYPASWCCGREHQSPCTAL